MTDRSVAGMDSDLPDAADQQDAGNTPDLDDGFRSGSIDELSDEDLEVDGQDPQMSESLATRPARLAPVHGRAAVESALRWVGRSYRVGWCQKFTNEVFQTGAVGDWDGDRAADAEDGWKKAFAAGKVVTAGRVTNLNSIPASVMLFWTGGSHDNGHAAVGIGNGQMVSTDLPEAGRVGKVSISKPHVTWGLTFAGYALIEGNGYDLGAYAPDGSKKGRLYTVCTKAGLYGRLSPAGPNVTVNGEMLVRPYGFTVRIVEFKHADGMDWAKGSAVIWYAAQYLAPRR